MELSPASLRTIRERGISTLLAVAGNALQLPFRDRSLDAVVAFEVIEHLPDIAEALDEVLRVLRRPGTSLSACRIMRRSGHRWRMRFGAAIAAPLASNVDAERGDGGGEMRP